MNKPFQRVLKKDRKTEFVNVPVSTALHVRLKAEANHRKISKTELARMFIETGLVTAGAEAKT